MSEFVRDGIRAGRSGELPGCGSYWLLFSGGAGTPPISLEGGTLPVFSTAGEAICFALVEGLQPGWIPRGVPAEELRMQLLEGSLGSFTRLALDPWPGSASDGTIALVSIEREAFLGGRI